jgi:hypothetical protein
MKSILIIVCLFPLLAVAQDCKVLKETDPYTKETKMSTGFISLQGGTLTIDVDSKEIDFFFTIENKCFNDAATVFVFFEGSKQKATFRNAGSMNCEGFFHFKFKNSQTTPLNVQKLSTLKVAQFIFNSDDKKPTVISLLPDQQETFMKAAGCVIGEGKSLVK